jgi:C4-dicarboxylate-specific signal transduction histidine kinase
MAALGELSFGVAHNVNNTLTGILRARPANPAATATIPRKIEAGLETDHQERRKTAPHIIRRIQDFASPRPKPRI